MTFQPPHTIECPATLHRTLQRLDWAEPTSQFAEWNIGLNKDEDLSDEPLIHGRTFTYAARQRGKITRAFLNFETPVSRSHVVWSNAKRRRNAEALAAQIREIRRALPGVPVIVYGPRAYWSDPADPRFDHMERLMAFYAEAGAEPDAWCVNGYIATRLEYASGPNLLARIDRHVERSRHVLDRVGTKADVVVATSPRCYWSEPVPISYARRSLMVDRAGMHRRRMISRGLRERKLTELIWYEPRDVAPVRSNINDLDPRTPKQAQEANR